jgi:pyruvate dehydrogenase E1 component
MDEPESMAALTLAARERLDNLVFVVNCNLQRLDGPVRGNGRIVDELEALFAGAGWNVIKLLWGSDWDGLFARDHTAPWRAPSRAPSTASSRRFSANDGAFNRERFFGKTPGTAGAGRPHERRRHRPPAARRPRPGEDPCRLRRAPSLHRASPGGRAGQDHEGLRHGRWRPGPHDHAPAEEARRRELLAFRDRFGLPLTDEQVEQAAFWRPAPTVPRCATCTPAAPRWAAHCPPQRTNAVPGGAGAPLAAAFAAFARRPRRQGV